MSQSTESPYDAAGTPELPAPTIERDPKQARKAATGAFLGTVVEMYDFLLYASAAGLVFPAVFFSELDPALAATLGFVSLLAGYISRPIGGLLFGHFGDVVGRKRMLLLSMLIMGGVSICIGLLPGEATLGAAAAVILTTLRVIQGIAIGGEYAGTQRYRQPDCATRSGCTAGHTRHPRRHNRGPPRCRSARTRCRPGPRIGDD